MKKRSPKVMSVTMSENHKTTQAKTPPAYPDKTTGSETASRVRKVANGWSEQKRSELFDRGMQIIYGGSGEKSKIRSR